MKIEQQTYKSSTLGEIQISFKGRHLLQTLREEIVEAINTGDPKSNWRGISKARGRIAEYIGALERTADRFFLSEVPTADLLRELEKRVSK